MLAPAGTVLSKMEGKRREHEMNERQQKNTRNTRQVELHGKGYKRMAGVSSHLEALVLEVRRDVNSDEIERQCKRLAEL